MVTREAVQPSFTLEDAQNRIGYIILSKGVGDPSEGYVGWHDEHRTSAYVNCPLAGCESYPGGLELVPNADGSITPNCYIGGHAIKDVRAWFREHLGDLKRSKAPAPRRRSQADLPVSIERDRNPMANAWRLLGLAGGQLLLSTANGDYPTVRVFHGPTGLWQEEASTLARLHSDICQLWQGTAQALSQEGTILPDEAVKLIGFLRNSQSAQRTEEAAKLTVAARQQMQAQGDERAEETTYCEEADFDLPNGTIAAANGLVDLGTGAIIQPDKARRHLVKRRQGTVEYVPGAKHWAVKKLFSHLHPDRADYLKACLGRAMWGEPDKVALFIIGPANSGKSTLYAALIAALGKPRHAQYVSEDLLRGMSGKQKTGPTEERRAMVQSRFALAEEAAGWMINSERLKALAGGSSTITYQEKYGKEHSMSVTATLMLSANTRPRLDLMDTALADRYREVVYTAPATRDPALKEAFLKDYEAAKAMFALLVEQAAANPPGRDIPIPPQVQQDIEDAVLTSMSSFDAWLLTALAPGEGNTSVQAVWRAWASHCEVEDSEDKIKGKERKSVASTVTKRFGVQTRMVWDKGAGKTARGYSGYVLAEGCDSPSFGVEAPPEAPPEQAPLDLPPPPRCTAKIACNGRERKHGETWAKTCPLCQRQQALPLPAEPSQVCEDCEQPLEAERDGVGGSLAFVKVCAPCVSIRMGEVG